MARQSTFESRKLIVDFRKVMRTLAVIILVMLVTSTLIDQYVDRYGAQFITAPAQAEPADAILVLGAYVFDDGRPSWMLEHRLETALELYQLGKAKKIIVSGDHGQQTYDEVHVMKKFLLDRGVPEENIFMDHAGFSTYDSVYRAQAIFSVKKVIVVTQRYHLVRAVFIARELGLDAAGVASDKADYGPVMIQYRIRDFAARNKDFIWSVFFKPKPTFLGEVIPVTGDGRLTEDRRN